VARVPGGCAGRTRFVRLAYIGGMGKAVLIVALVALIIYGLLRLWERRRAARRPGSTQFPPPPGRRVIAPDDDVDFLRDLERRRRRERKKPKDEQRGDSET
jgi:hypothetical protein